MSNNGKFIIYETIIHCFLFGGAGGGGETWSSYEKPQAYMEQSGEENVNT